MLRNLFTVAIRNLKRQKFFSILHIIGLSIGVAACLTVWLYSHHELSYDQFHEKADRIVRVNQTFIWGDTDDLFGSTGPAVIHALRSEIPEFESLTRAHTPGSRLVRYNAPDKLIMFEEDNIVAADSNFLQVFTFPLLRGNPATALTHPNSVVLTATTAQRYFGSIDVLGKQLEMGEGDQQKTVQVTGVAEDLPGNSHIEFDFLLSMSSFPRVQRQADSWMWTTFITFGVLRPDASLEQVAQKVAQVPGKYLEPFLQKYRGISYEEFKASGEEWDLYLQPLLDIHLRSTNVYSRLNEVNDIKTLYILWMVAGLTLLLSLINFINLSTARSTARAKEVGVRKVIGSGRSLLIFQFLTESVLLATAAVVVGILLTELSLSLFNQAMNTDLALKPFQTILLLPSMAIIALGMGALAGIYPAFYLSSFRPAQVLKGTIQGGTKGTRVRNLLVTLQFTISIGLIGSTLIIQEQVHYWQSFDLGFDRDNKIIIQHANRLGNSFEAFKNDLLSNPLIEQVTYASDTPPLVHDFDNFTLDGQEEKQLSVNYVATDEHFTDVFGLEIIHGRSFSKAFNESNNIIVNRRLTQNLGFTTPEEALQHKLEHYGQKFTIIGVMDDFTTSLSGNQYPFAILANNAPIYRDSNYELTLNLSREVQPEELTTLLQTLEAQWQATNPKAPFSYAFVDQEYMQLFSQAIVFGKMLRALAILAVLIACLGLIGLIAYVIDKRNKEIGIRKVLGASMSSIWLLLSRDFGKLLGIGFVLAIPATWHLMNLWLEDYPIRTAISMFTLLAAGGIMLCTTLITMSFQTIKAAQIDPVKYLKEE
ncbi:ABC transporter permease [Marinoscillum furvescens]|uniref:Putative ABC transport system permease protein n=1 Tax=Marinoscillum furvescens DSM 4134 TaxID=1122208 RepID=A0A3D9LH72_MARFU|nr:ABC transporter permease [Marinoscillum furvescens]REE05958.1 putative ABC transport system permease protein [Marinoscillum furvescens DSM 4134]